jgi:hypothetical protein
VEIQAAESPENPGRFSPSKWGNPYKVADYGRPEAVRLYKEHLRQRPELVEAARRELRGRDLACWCAPGVECHADLLMAAANEDWPPDGDPSAAAAPALYRP